MALQQLNLKLPPAVLDRWRAQAAAEGLSIRDWLVAITAPAAVPQAGPGTHAELLERVTQLESVTAELAQSVALLEAPRPPRPAVLAPRSGDAPSPIRVMTAAADVPANGI